MRKLRLLTVMRLKRLNAPYNNEADEEEEKFNEETKAFDIEEAEEVREIKLRTARRLTR